MCCSSWSLDGGYTDAEVGELRDIESYQFKPEMDEIPAEMAKPKEGLESGIRVHNGSLFFLLFTNKKKYLTATEVLNVQGLIR